MASSPQSDNVDNTARQLLAFRASRALANGIRQVARRDAETAASTLRRLIRIGLDAERRGATTDRGDR
jgi:hypothetical protein